MSLNFWRAVLSGVFGGTVAGVLLGLLILLLLTPIIIKAEKFEHSGLSAAEQVKEGQQHHWGTVIGSILLGLVYGLIATLLFLWFSHQELTFRWGLKLGLIGFLLAYLGPSFLIFPPNPPGVEATASVAVRQSWWLTLILIELAAVWFYRWLLQNLPAAKAHTLGIGTFVGIWLLFSRLAPNGLEKLEIPKALLFNFRLTSFVVMLIFWLTLGLIISLTYSWLANGKAADPKEQLF